MSFCVGGRAIGGGAPCFIVAEAGVNHNGDVRLGHRLIDIAADAGADAVKFQTFRAESLASPLAGKAAYQAAATDAGESQLAMLKRLELAAEDYVALKAHCAERRILFLSTPFDADSADLLERLDVPAFKLPSGEVTNLPFLRHVAGKGRPIILSTGMATLDEVGAAVATISAAGAPPLALLHCTSAYPAPASESNLRAMATMRERFSVPVGYSDHTPGIAVSLAATTLGAAIVEKHFTVDQTLPGPDHRASLTPDGLKALVVGIREAEIAMGDGVKRPQPSERDVARVARKSVVALRDLPAGTVLAPEMVRIMRPGTGIAPAFHSALIGRRVARAIKSGMPIGWDDLESGNGRAPVLLFCKTDDWSARAVTLAKAEFGDRLMVFSGQRNDPTPAPPACRYEAILSFLSPWILPPQMLDRATIALNFHPGSCDYPGIGCYNFALYERVKNYGAVCHHMTKQVDTGSVVLERLFAIATDETVMTLKQRTLAALLEMFGEVLTLLRTRHKLPSASRQWTRRPFRRSELDALGRIASGMKPDEVRRRVRAMTFPGCPGAFTEIGGVKFSVPPETAPGRD